MSQEGSESLLQKALYIQLKCAELGFDWPEAGPVFDKVLEEIDEIKAELNKQQVAQHKVEDEVGDLLFAVVNLSRHLKVHPDIALKKASDKFEQRFALVEKLAAADNLKLNSLSIDNLETLWQKAKKIVASAH